MSERLFPYVDREALERLLRAAAMLAGRSIADTDETIRQAMIDGAEELLRRIPGRVSAPEDVPPDDLLAAAYIQGVAAGLLAGAQSALASVEAVDAVRREMERAGERRAAEAILSVRIGLAASGEAVALAAAYAQMAAASVLGRGGDAHGDARSVDA